MKTFALTTILLFTMTALMANPGCRNHVANLNVELTASQLVKQDLLLGVWTFTSEEGKINTLQFEDYGLVEFLTTNKEGETTYSNMMWRVEEYDGLGFLILTGNDMKHELSYRVVQTCEGIILKNVISEEKIEMTYIPKASIYLLGEASVKLYGDWTSITDPLEEASQTNGAATYTQAKGAYLHYSFEPDGTFTCEFGDNQKQALETGYWEFSQDGQFLIFFVSEAGNQQRIVESRVAKLNHMDNHILFLEHSMLSRDFLGFKNKTITEIGFIK